MRTPMLKIFVDDVRDPPDDSWTLVRTYDDAINFITINEWDIISLDHDLGDTHHIDNAHLVQFPLRERTGYMLLEHIVGMQEEYGLKVGKVLVHSANPVAQEKMRGTIERYLTGHEK